MSELAERQHVRVLIANQRSDRLDYVTRVVVGLGHDVVARSIEVREVAFVTRRERPDVALVGRGDSTADALELIGVTEATREDLVGVGRLSPSRAPTHTRPSRL